MNVGPQCFPATTLWGLPAAAWPAPFHNPPPLWVRQPGPCRESSLPRLPLSTLPTGLDECFFFISLVVGLPYSSIFCQFWLCFVFKLLSFFWLCEEAQCVYLCLHLGRKPNLIFIVFLPLPFSPLILPSPSSHHTLVHVPESFFLFSQSLHPLTSLPQ